MFTKIKVWFRMLTIDLEAKRIVRKQIKKHGLGSIVQFVPEEDASKTQPVDGIIRMTPSGVILPFETPEL